MLLFEIIEELVIIGGRVRFEFEEQFISKTARIEETRKSLDNY